MFRIHVRQKAVAFTSRVVECKGIDDLVRLMGGSSGLSGLVLSAGATEADAMQLAKSLDRDDRIRFVGRVDDVMSYLPAADVLAIPPRNPMEGGRWQCWKNWQLARLLLEQRTPCLS